LSLNLRARLPGVFLVFFLTAGCAGQQADQPQSGASTTQAPTPTSAPDAPPAPAPAPAPGPGADPVSRAQWWLASQGDDLPSYAPLILDYLRRRYASPVPVHADLARVAAAEDTDQMRVYLRLLDPGVRITRADLEALDDEIDQLTGPALACDQVPLPAGHLELLGRAIEAGGYPRTHAVLALQWLREHGCVPEPDAASLAEDWAGSLVGTVEQQRSEGNGASDLAVEAMVMLVYSGHGGLIRQEWLDTVRAAQHPDGSWPRGVEDDLANPHATVLAYWLVLDRDRPGATAVPWIPEP